MPEALTAAQRDLAARADRFADEVLVPLAARHADDPAALRAAVVDASKEAGFFTMTQPASHGGRAASTLELTLLRERFAATAEPARRHVFGPGPGVLADAQGELAETCLRPVLAGTKRSAFAFTEPAGARPTTARRVDGHWRVDGVKSYVTGGSEADFLIVVARIADDDGEAGRDAIMLVVDADQAGVTRSEPFTSMDGSAHVAFTFAAVQVPDARVVGRPGEGLPRALRQIGDVRVIIAAEACGLMQCALTHLETHLQRPHRSGGALGDREGVRLRFADARIDAFAARSMLYRTARLADSGENAVNEGIATKVFATEAAGRVVDTALQLEGGQALVRGELLERLYREVRALRFTEGASDVLRLNLARGRLELGKGRV
ncbi:MAG TPA: acyl-CoA dehydrogenase family protein [Pseudomonadales bacterium]|nr:acyl-CoA dehydrogenase family protein [Pseudomonadales bacterium]